MLKKNRIFIIIFLMSLSFQLIGQSSRKIKKLETQIIELKKAFSDSIQTLESKLLIQKNEIDQLNSNDIKIKNEIEKNSIYRTFYSANIKSLTTIFSIIITLAIFIIGFIIPNYIRKEFESKYKSLSQGIESKLLLQKEELNLISKGFKSLKTDVVDEMKKIEKTELINSRSHSKAMYFISRNIKFNEGSILWALRHLNSIIKIDELNGKDFDESRHDSYLTFAGEHVNNLGKDTIITENSIDELNKLILDLKKGIKKEKNIELLNKIQKLYCQKHWSKPENNDKANNT